MKIYRDNITKYTTELLQLNKALNRVSFLRLLIFILSSVVLITLFSKSLFIPFVIVLSISVVGFALVVKMHNKLSFRKKHNTCLKDINESEILREKCKLENFETGNQFSDPNHPYTSDLDIFGQHSIFQLVNRTTTESGRILLAECLSEPAPKNEIKARQEAVKDLAQKLEWRQNFQASGMPFQNKKSDYQKLLNWVETPAALLNYRGLYLTIAILLSVLSMVSISLLVANLNSFNGVIYLAVLFVVVTINLLIIRKINPEVEAIVETSQENIDTFKGYRALVYHIEHESFESEKLRTLQAQLLQGNYSAYHEINRICRLLEFSQQRPIKKIPVGGNFLYSLLNTFFLIDVHLVIGTEKWKAKNKSFLKSWAYAVSEFEVINSFAGFYYSNPSIALPEISEKNNLVHFESIGHPLINAEKRVNNTFHSDGDGHVVMITGSNMGGKSTFLRAVGVNIVLALAGAPCCAEQCEVSNLQLFTSMRTQDNLREGVSSFYAELNSYFIKLKKVTMYFFSLMRCLREPIPKTGIKEDFP